MASSATEFTAPWSGPDQLLKPVLREMATARRLPPAIVDVDGSPALARRYDVLAIPTLLAFVDGRPSMPPKVGALPRPRLERFLARSQTR